MHDLHHRDFAGRRDQIVDQARGVDLALLVVDEFLVERGADALRHAAVHLAVDDQRIDELAAIFGDDETIDADLDRFPDRSPRRRYASPTSWCRIPGRRSWSRRVRRAHPAAMRLIPNRPRARSSRNVTERSVPATETLPSSATRSAAEASSRCEAALSISPATPARPASRRRRPAPGSGLHRCRSTPGTAALSPCMMRMSSKRAPRCSATICASVVSRPWPCEATPNAARDAAGRIDADDRGFGAGIDRHARRDRDARADAGQFRVAGDADADPAAGGARRLCSGAKLS